MSWSNDTVLEFLERYRSEQLLWDSKHPLHRNRSEVSEAWQRIQSCMSIHCSITDLKKKKESLMTSFRMHLSKKKAQDGYRITWFAYPIMESFLSGRYECDSTNQMENEFYTNTGNYNIQPVTSDSCGIAKDINNSDKISTPVRQSKSQCQKNSQSGKKSLEMLHAKKRVAETVSYMKNPSDIKSEMDEYDLYGQLLAKKLRKLDEHQRDLAMHEIDNVMFRAKIKRRERSFSTSPSPVPRKIKSPIFIVAQQQNGMNIQFEDENLPYSEQHPS